MGGSDRHLWWLLVVGPTAAFVATTVALDLGAPLVAVALAAVGVLSGVAGMWKGGLHDD